MKEVLTILWVIIGYASFGQATDYSTDTHSVESTISALYEVISGDPDATRDWNRFRNLFKPEARLIPTRKDEQGNLTLRTLSPEQYIELFSSRISSGFYETELHRVTETFGTVTHVFSTYETKDKKDGPVTNRGINSIQLFKDSERYYIVNIFWCAESMGYVLPEKYLR